jgi:FSR family fosmidomycin resistance protein-like MFS transporter
MTAITLEDTRTTDVNVISLVGLAHFISHVFILVLPPLFPFVRADFNVTYTELGAVLAMFSIVSTILQIPAGFLVDRTSARAVLVGGLLLSAGSLVLASAVSSFYLFGLAFALLGVANTIYHPADYALLSGRVSALRMTRAYSIHIFAGYIGTAITPALLLAIASYAGWRGAFLFAAMLGFAAAMAILLFGRSLEAERPVRKAAEAETARAAAADWRVLMTVPVLLNLFFFILIAIMLGGMQSFGIVALEAAHGISLSLATLALTAFLVMNAAAVLVGGWVGERFHRHDLIAIVGLVLNAAALIPVALLNPNPVLLVGLMGLAGFFVGFIQPSRDMIVRSVTPPGAFGRVFGFVSTGFNLGGVLAALVFGYLMDHGSPRTILLIAAGCAIVAIPTVLVTVAQRRAAPTV